MSAAPQDGPEPPVSTAWEHQPLPSHVCAPVPPPLRWIGNVLPALGWAASRDMPSLPSLAEDAARAFGLEPCATNVVIMVDGLGLDQLLAKLGHAPTLRRLPTRPVAAQTCAPSTTSAALTAFATGELPGQTRMVGYSVPRPHGAGTMNLIQFEDGVDAAAWQPVPTYFQRFAGDGLESALVTDPRFQFSGLTNAAMRGPRFVASSTLDARFEQAVDQVRRGSAITYVYWSKIDKTGHGKGPDSLEWTAALEDFDLALSRFLRAIDGKAQVLLTADHGMIEVGQRVDLAHVPALSRGVRLLAGEGRAAHVHAEPGQGDAVLRRWREYWGEDAWVFGPQQFAQVLGEGPGLELVGDVLVMPKGRTVVVDSRTQTPSSIAMKGAHGSLTQTEMLIPVWRLA